MARRGNWLAGLYVGCEKDGVYLVVVVVVVSGGNNRGHASIYIVHMRYPRDPNDRRDGCAKVSAVRNSIDAEPETPSLPRVRSKCVVLQCDIDGKDTIENIIHSSGPVQSPFAALLD